MYNPPGDEMEVDLANAEIHVKETWSFGALLCIFKDAHVCAL
jgi:hypothetical protein